MNEDAVSTDAPRQMPVSGAVIVLENLTVSYGAHQVLKGLSLEVPAGSIFGFLGANGASKTTTIKTLLGFRPPNGGSAQVLGYDVVSQHVEICMHVGYVSETNSLYDFLNIQELCALCRDMQRRWEGTQVVGHKVQCVYANDIEQCKKLRCNSLMSIVSRTFVRLAIGLQI